MGVPPRNGFQESLLKETTSRKVFLKYLLSLLNLLEGFLSLLKYLESSMEHGMEHRMSALPFSCFDMGFATGFAMGPALVATLTPLGHALLAKKVLPGPCCNSSNGMF